VIAKVEWHRGELFPRIGFIVTNLSRSAKRVVRFYNQRGTAEQWIKEGKNAVRWTRLCERNNLNMRMGMRRFTRLTNAFSKKVENLEHQVALHFMNYNFCRIHQSLRVTPAMEAGVADHVWTMEEVVALIDGN
jgi:hypothetical protein